MGNAFESKNVGARLRSSRDCSKRNCVSTVLCIGEAAARQEPRPTRTNRLQAIALLQRFNGSRSAKRTRGSASLPQEAPGHYEVEARCRASAPPMSRYRIAVTALAL